MKIFSLLGIGTALLLAASAHAEIESSVTANVNYLSGANSPRTNVTNPDYSLQFQTGVGGPWLRSDFGATIERASGGGDTLMSGNIFGGAALAHKAGTRLTPFMGLDAILGWGNYSSGSTNNNGLLYGGMLSAGAEFAIKKTGGNRLAFILKTGYRMLSGSLGSLKGSDLNAVTLGIGLAWSDGGGGSDRGEIDL